MSENEKSNPKPIEDAIADLGRASFQEPAICTGWVLVTEWFGGNNEYWIMSLHDESSPPWRHSGMLDYAMNRITEEVDSYLGEEIGWDEDTDE